MRHLLTMVLVGLAALDPGAGFAQAERRLTPEQLKDVDAAVAYFEGGGAWSFRFASSPAAAAESTAGSIIVLRPARSKVTRYTLGNFQFDTPPKDPMVVLTVAAVLENSDTRAAFADRFAKGIDAGRLQAYAINRSPKQDKEPFSLEGTTGFKSEVFVTFFRQSIMK